MAVIIITTAFIVFILALVIILGALISRLKEKTESYEKILTKYKHKFCKVEWERIQEIMEKKSFL